MPISEEKLREYLVSLIFYMIQKRFFPEPKIPIPLSSQVSYREVIRKGG